VALLEFAIGIANVGHAIDPCDRDLKATGGEQSGELREYLGSRSDLIAFSLYAIRFGATPNLSASSM
jgi:hypothetical protein